MRRHLKQIDGQRTTFTGTFVRFGTKPAFRGPDLPTVLLSDVRDPAGKLVAEHLWFNRTKEFSLLNRNGLKAGDRVQFDARVTPYIKGYFGHREDVYKPIERDYRLSRPTHLVNLGQADAKDKVNS